MSPLTRYIDAWTANDADAIAAAVTDDCTITECYGPIYQGRARIRQWAQTWLNAGGIVHAWTITDHFTNDDREAAQWLFVYTWQGTHDTIEGSTIATAEQGLVTSLREYQTTAPLYEWTGSWR